MIEFDEAAWGWYRHKAYTVILNAQNELHRQFGSSSTVPLHYFQELLDQPERSLRLRASMKGFSADLKRLGRPVPMKGLSVSEIVTASQARQILANMKGREASHAYLQIIKSTTCTPETRLKYANMAHALRPLLQTAQVVLRYALIGQVEGPVLVTTLVNFRYLLLTRFWLECHRIPHPILEGTEVLREQGACLMWFNGAEAVAMIADDPFDKATTT